MTISTFAGIATRGETYSKFMHHLGECQELAAVMAHLHNTETTHKDIAMARGWLTVSEMFKQMRGKIISLASGNLQ